MGNKKFFDMNEKERKAFHRANYLRGQYLHGACEIIGYGREIERDSEYELAVMEVVDRYVTMDKVI